MRIKIHIILKQHRNRIHAILAHSIYVFHMLKMTLEYLLQTKGTTTNTHIIPYY